MQFKESHMKLYSLFLLMATATVFSPGPGVVMTLTNALRYGMRGTFAGILGIALGALVVATISATSLGVLLAASALAFTVLKFIGAGYLIYLGIRLWRAPAFKFAEQSAHEASFGRRFLEGLSLQLTNPKAIFFFLSVFPQFIDTEKNYSLQFTTLVLTYSVLVVVIHCTYAFFAKRAKGWLASERGGRAVNKAAGATFVFFGAALATAKR
jgi:homoserine/homoserine lactone efflux protein